MDQIVEGDSYSINDESIQLHPVEDRTSLCECSVAGDCGQLTCQTHGLS